MRWDRPSEAFLGYRSSFHTHSFLFGLLSAPAAALHGKLKTMFVKLRESWIRIANNAQFQDAVEENARRLSAPD
jgi:hypothetical protein